MAYGLLVLAAPTEKVSRLVVWQLAAYCCLGQAAGDDENHRTGLAEAAKTYGGGGGKWAAMASSTAGRGAQQARRTKQGTALFSDTT